MVTRERTPIAVGPRRNPKSHSGKTAEEITPRKPASGVSKSPSRIVALDGLSIFVGAFAGPRLPRRGILHQLEPTRSLCGNRLTHRRNVRVVKNRILAWSRSWVQRLDF